MKSGPRILIRCDGSAEVGLGHVVRCLALADELKENHNCRVTFAMKQGPVGYEIVRKKGYKVVSPSKERQDFDYDGWLP